MPSGLSKALRILQQNFIFQAAAAPAPTAANSFLAFHTADPLDDGSAGAANEVTGTSYARVQFTLNNTNFSVASTPANDAPSIVSNAVAFQSPVAGGTWTTAAFWGLWTSGTIGGGTLLARGPVSPSQTCLNGQRITVPIGSATFGLSTS
jgi:hypothetical protein